MTKHLICGAIILSFIYGNTAIAEEHHNHSHNESDINSETRVIDIINENINDKNRYTPAVIVVKKGEKVRLNIFNTTALPHGFSIDEFRIKETLNPKQNTIEFVPDKAGLFTIYCQFHPAHLRGQILVIE